MAIYVINIRFEGFGPFEVYPDSWLLEEAGYFTDYESALCAAEKYISDIDTEHEIIEVRDAKGNLGYSACSFSCCNPHMSGRYEAVVIKLSKGT